MSTGKKVLWVVIVVLLAWGLYGASKSPEMTGPIKIGFIHLFLEMPPPTVSL
jgi:hypothetical protein